MTTIRASLIGLMGFFIDKTYRISIEECYNWKMSQENKEKKCAFLPLLVLSLMMTFLRKGVSYKSRKRIK